MRSARKFLRAIAEVPTQITTEFYYADRRVGGLGTFKLADEADVWTIARATQLLSSKDTTIRAIFRKQLLNAIHNGFQKEHRPAILPVAAYLSGSTEGGMYRLQTGHTPKKTLWGAARNAARRLKVRVDVSGDWNMSIIAEDVRFPPCKAVKGLHTAVRQHHTRRFTTVKFQGAVAATLATDMTSAKFIAKLISTRTTLSRDDWPLLFRARLESLPLRGYPWLGSKDKSCRRCRSDIETGSRNETGFHVFNNCEKNLQLYTTRHNLIQYELVKILRLAGTSPEINKRLPGTDIEGRSRKPDIEFSMAGSRIMVDVTVAFDSSKNIEAAFQKKIEKYRSFGIIKPLVVGSLGFWHPKNDEIWSLAGINPKIWARFKNKARTIAIEQSLNIFRSHVSSFPACTDPIVALGDDP